MSLRNRIARLENGNALDGRCPTCQHRPEFRTFRQDGLDATPVLKAGYTDDGCPCPLCGWQPRKLVELVVYSREDVKKFNAMERGITR